MHSKAIPLYLEDTKTKYWLALIFSFLLVGLTQIRYLNHICNFNDCGYFLTNQELALKIGIKQVVVVPWWWFSDIVGGWWLQFVGSKGIWEAKLGGVLCVALAGAISAQTIFLLYKPNLYVVLGIAFAGLCIVNEMINYISVPTLLYALFSYFFLKQTLYPNKIMYSIGTAITFSLLVFSRMPLIVGIILPGLCLFFSKWIDRTRYIEYRKSYTITYLGIAICFGVFAIFLHQKGLLTGYLFPEAHSKDHTVYSLITLLLGQILEKSVKIATCALLGFVFFYSVKKSWLSTRISFFCIALLFLVNLALAILSIKHPSVKEFTKITWPDSFDLYLIAFSILCACFWVLKDEIKYPEFVLALLAISWPILRTLGSAIGIYWGIFLGFLICGVLMQWVTRVGIRYNCRGALYLLCAIFGLIAGGRALKGQIDLGSPTFVKVEMEEIPKMEGIFISPIIIENMRPLLNELKIYVAKGDKILASPYLPMVYFLSETSPLGDHSCLEFLDSKQYMARLETIANSKPPKVIVRPKVDFTRAERQEVFFKWPTRSDFLEDLRNKWVVFDDLIMKRWGAKLVWSNEFFEIFSINSEINKGKIYDEIY